MENKLDGNAAAGTLQEIFPFEMTLVQITCTLSAYRCAHCARPGMCLKPSSCPTLTVLHTCSWFLGS
jgi:Family of unknown function (DUF6510)